MAVAAVIAHGRLLRSRPAAQPVPRGQSVLTAGAHELLATLRETRRARPELLRFLVGHMFADACVVSIPPRERFRPLRGNASLVRARTTRTPPRRFPRRTSNPRGRSPTATARDAAAPCACVVSRFPRVASSLSSFNPALSRGVRRSRLPPCARAAAAAAAVRPAGCRRSRRSRRRT